MKFIKIGDKLINLALVKHFEFGETKSYRGQNAFNEPIRNMAQDIIVHYIDGSHDDIAHEFIADFEDNISHQIDCLSTDILPAPHDAFKLLLWDENKKRVVDEEGFEVLAFLLATRVNGWDLLVPISIRGIPGEAEVWCVIGSNGRAYDNLGNKYPNAASWADAVKTGEHCGNRYALDPEND